MKVRKPYLLALFLFASTPFLDAKTEIDDTLIEYKPVEGMRATPPEALAKWRERKLALFIHWTVTADRGRSVTQSHSRHSRFKPSGKIPPEEYDLYYKEFNPVRYNPQEWTQMAQDAGLKYIVYVSKHHDGFSLFDTAYSEYDIMSSPYGKDVLKMLADACRASGVELGLYYSPRDWYHPAFDTDRHDPEYNDFYLAQMTELATNYGPIVELWFDGMTPAGPDKWKDTPEQVAEMLRELHPDIMLNPRGGVPADFETYETKYGPYKRDIPWQRCSTLTVFAWNYRTPDIPVRSIEELLDELVYTIGRGGNYLLNIGPRADGSLDENHVRQFRAFGEFVKPHGEAIYGTIAGPFIDGAWGASTAKGNTTYLFIRSAIEGPFQIPLSDAEIESASLLNPAGKLSFEKTETGYALDLPPVSDDWTHSFRVVKLQLDQPATRLDPRPLNPYLVPTSLAASSSKMGQPAENAADDSVQTYWQPASPKDQVAWLEYQYDQPVTFNHVSLGYDHGWMPVTSSRIEAYQEGEWKVLLQMKDPVARPFHAIEPTTTNRIRFVQEGRRSNTLEVVEMKVWFE